MVEPSIVRSSSLLLAAALLSCGARVEERSERESPTSRETPPLRAFASSSCAAHPAAHAADGDAATTWRSCSIPSAAAPTWLAYDIRGLGTKRNAALVLWYNQTVDYDVTVFSPGRALNLPREYTLEGHPAGGDVPPDDLDRGWVVLEEVKRNTVHSRQSLLGLSAYSWLRIRVTASDGIPGQYEVELGLDLYEARAREDDWMFFGDSITAVAMARYPLFLECTLCDRRIDSFASMLRARQPGRTPVDEAGGINGVSARVAAPLLPAWLAEFPGRYVALAFGTNDAGACDATCVSAFGRAYRAMIASVLAAKKIPLVPSIPPVRDPVVNESIQQLNAELSSIASSTAGVVVGPDFYGHFATRLDRLGPDGVHLNAEGYAEYRALWVDVAAKLTR